MTALFQPLAPWFFAPLPVHHFNFIAIDPPWHFDLYSEEGAEKSALAQYASMSDSEILALPVRDLAAGDCLLYCWATAPRLDLAMAAVKAWGFTYLSLLVWEKTTASGKMRWGTGYRVRTTAEPILVASIGNPTERAVMLNIFDAARKYGKLVVDDRDGPRAAVGREVIEWSHYADEMLKKMVSVSEEDAEAMKKERNRIRMEFDRAKTALIKGNVIGVERPFMWWTGRPIRGFAHTFPRKGPAQAMWRDDAPPLPSPDDSPGMAEILHEAEVPF